MYRFKSSALLRPFHQRCLRAYASTVVDDLRARGFVQAVTSEHFSQASSKPLAVYLGVDPTATSLHAGNLLAMLGLLHFHIRGHQAIALVGGATGTIGDPSGRSSERTFLDKAQLDANVASITAQYERFLERGQAYADARTGRSGCEVERVGPVQTPKVVNNMDWFGQMSLLDFLRGTGKHAKVQTMLAKDSVKSRLASESGISFTEFSYQLLQAQDFLHLHLQHGCAVQLGGSDQWGNIVAGIDLIHRHYADALPAPDAGATAGEGGAAAGGNSKKRKAAAQKAAAQKAARQERAFGLTIPLLTTASGEKFGKSAGNAVWLDERLTSLFDFYQFFFRTTDADVGRYLKLFTLLSLEQIEAVLTKHAAEPNANSAQRTLAAEVTQLVHGEAGLAKALVQTDVLFSSVDPKTLDAGAVLDAFAADRRLLRVGRADLPVRLSQIALAAGAVSSNKAAQRIIASGGLYVNGAKVGPPAAPGQHAELTAADLLDGRLAVIQVGKGNHVLVEIE